MCVCVLSLWQALCRQNIVLTFKAKPIQLEGLSYLITVREQHYFCRAALCPILTCCVSYHSRYRSMRCVSQFFLYATAVIIPFFFLSFFWNNCKCCKAGLASLPFAKWLWLDEKALDGMRTVDISGSVSVRFYMDLQKASFPQCSLVRAFQELPGIFREGPISLKRKKMPWSNFSFVSRIYKFTTWF